MNLIQAVWSRLHEPRAVTFMAMIIYVMSGFLGWALLLLPPGGPLSTWEVVVGLGDSLALILGASVALVAAMDGRWWLERVGTWTILVAYVAQVPLLWGLFPTAAWHLLLVISVLEACAGLGLRLATISWAYLDPMREE